MSYQIQAILTDGRKVRGVYGSNDFSVMEKFCEDEFYEYDAFIEDRFDLETGELSSKKLLENIICGTTDKSYNHLLLNKEDEKFSNSALAAVYSYLHRDLCLIYGKTINRNKDSWPMFTAYLDEFETRCRAFFKIPYSLDFPHIFCVLYEERDVYKQLYTEKLTKRYAEDKATLAELLKDIEFVFDQMKETGLDLFFCNS
ncbi:DUF7691 family protein [Sinomicrobium weinanense]|uniref:DUF7691 domain-containing protein n=1 Tax=Sinomicrobium weinanense TaxID=2842200 RepID=A0A926Q2S2_9FLAO|nr:hypothetical protein [Sinomicrobium weinanense]MBC9795236.1 hypothetical protein [Sinomicrobium weinanense]MBU3122013.1 hypothetical protein [Sinomicrobium weinanense]